MTATQEPARRVLMRALQLHRIRRTYALLHGPEEPDNMFGLNIWDFPTKAQAQPSATQGLQRYDARTLLGALASAREVVVTLP
jgi:hypothetical protein